jgi:hypothetical protein
MAFLPCLPKVNAGGEEKMSSLTMILYRMIEILLKVPRTWGRLGKKFGVYVKSYYLSLVRYVLATGLNRERKIIDSSCQGRVGFRNIMKINWQFTSGSPSFFLPCLRQVDMSGFVEPFISSIPS